MSILDAFFSFAVPFVVISIVVARVAQRYAGTQGIYQDADGRTRREAINARYHTNAGAIVIGGIFLVLWGVIVGALVEQWGAVFFTFVVAALLLLPIITVAACAVMLYTFAVHGFASIRDR